MLITNYDGKQIGLRTLITNGSWLAIKSPRSATIDVMTFMPVDSCVIKTEITMIFMCAIGQINEATSISFENCHSGLKGKVSEVVGCMRKARIERKARIIAWLWFDDVISSSYESAAFIVARCILIPLVAIVSA